MQFSKPRREHHRQCAATWRNAGSSALEAGTIAAALCVVFPGAVGVVFVSAAIHVVSRIVARSHDAVANDPARDDYEVRTQMRFPEPRFLKDSKNPAEPSLVRYADPRFLAGATRSASYRSAAVRAMERRLGAEEAGATDHARDRLKEGAHFWGLAQRTAVVAADEFPVFRERLSYLYGRTVEAASSIKERPSAQTLAEVASTVEGFLPDAAYDALRLGGFERRETAANVVEEALASLDEVYSLMRGLNDDLASSLRGGIDLSSLLDDHGPDV